ncbi:MAG TPA: hypothetical protein VNO17_07780 [Actinomycetota bacterium]|nr:hypothetical protein [Actinomycetota bacterium]
MDARPVPRTEERAATALVRCRRYVEGAAAELDLAVEILRSIEPGSPRLPWLEQLAARLGEVRGALAGER